MRQCLLRDFFQNVTVNSAEKNSRKHKKCNIALRKWHDENCIEKKNVYQLNVPQRLTI